MLVSVDLVNNIFITDDRKSFFFTNQLDENCFSSSFDKVLDEISSKIEFKNVSNVIFCCPDNFILDEEYFLGCAAKRIKLKAEQISFVGKRAPIYDFWIDQCGKEIGLKDIVALIRVVIIQGKVHYSVDFFAVRIKDEKPESMVFFGNIPPTNVWQEFKDSYDSFKWKYPQHNFLEIYKLDNEMDDKVLKMFGCKFLKLPVFDRANGAMIRLKSKLDILKNKILAEEYADESSKLDYVIQKSPGFSKDLPKKPREKIHAFNNSVFPFKKSSFLECLPERPMNNGKTADEAKELQFFGIDLGTTSCCIAMATKMPTKLPDETRQLVGRCAVKELGICHLSILDEHLKLAKMDDPNIVFDVKRMIGKSFEEVLKINGNKWPFEVVEHRSSVEINLNGTKMAPEFVLSKLLENLVENAEKELNEPIREAVIAVPTNFDEKQKNSVKAFAQMAGVQVTELINEPVAAFYDFKRAKINLRPGTVIFIADLGGGTFDAAVIKDNPTKPKICCLANGALGGRDFDAIVVELITEKIDAKFPKYADLLQPKTLIFQAEAVKIQLSTKEAVEIKLNLLMPNLPKSGETILITRTEFEKRAANLIKMLKDAVDHILEKSQQSNINHVVLIGGGCQMPCFQKIVREKFPTLEFDEIERVEFTVARGAALRAYSLAKNTWP